MAFNKIRGQQIKNGAITGAHIQNNVIGKEHLAQSAIKSILESKLVVDYVQLANPIDVTTSTSSLDITISGEPVAESNATDLGVLLGKKVIIRNAATGEPIYNPNHKHEVFGKLSHDGSKYTIAFGCYESNQEFTPYTFTEEVSLNVQYAQRFTLASVDEMFAANEKFVDGAVDVTAALKIKELQQKLEKLTTDSTEGTEALRQAIQEQIDTINDVIGKDATPETYVQTEDEAPQPDKTYYTKNLEEYVQADTQSGFTPEVTYYEKVEAVEATGIKAVLAKYATDIDANNKAIQKNAEEIEALKAADTTINEKITALEGKDTEIEGKITDLEAADAELAKKLAAHKKYVVQIDALASKTQVELPEGMLFKKLTGDAGLYEDCLYVYVNGLLQAEDINFTQIEDDTHLGYCKGILFGDDQLVEGDVVVIKWINEVVE